MRGTNGVCFISLFWFDVVGFDDAFECGCLWSISSLVRSVTGRDDYSSSSIVVEVPNYQ